MYHSSLGGRQSCHESWPLLEVLGQEEGLGVFMVGGWTTTGLASRRLAKLPSPLISPSLPLKKNKDW